MNIPDPYSQKRLVATPNKSVVQQDTSAVAKASGSLAVDLNQRADRRTEYQVAQARARLLTEQANREEQLQTDREYEDIPERYENDIREQLSGAAELINDRRARQAFIEFEGEARVQEGLGRARARAFDVEADIGRNGVNESLNQLNKIAVSGPDPRAAIDTVEDMLSGAVEAGYYDAEQAGNVVRAWKDQFAVDKISSLPPSRRLQALSEPWADNLPSQTRARLIERAEVDQREVAAVQAVDDIIDQGLSRTEARRQLRDIEDVDLRKEAEGRLDYELRQRDAEEVDAQTDIIERRHMEIRSGQLRVSELPREEIEALTAAQVSGLESLEASAFTAPTRSDRAVIAKIYEAIDAGDMTAARRVVLDNAGGLSDSDFEQYLGKTAQDVSATQIESIRTLGQTLDDTIRNAGITDKKSAANAKGELRQQLDHWAMEYQRTNDGKEPTDQELEEQASALSTRFILERRDWVPFNDRKGRVFEGDISVRGIPDEHVGAVLGALGGGETVRADEAAVTRLYEDVVEQYKARGVSNPTPAEIADGVVYIRSQGEANAD